MANVLVIDDEDLVQYTVSTILSRAGHRVKLVETGREGLRTLGEASFDLVIVDLTLNDRNGNGPDGPETVARISGAFPDLTVVGMSGGGRLRNQDHGQSLAPSCIRFTLAKPFTELELMKVVEAALVKQGI